MLYVKQNNPFVLFYMSPEMSKENVESGYDSSLSGDPGIMKTPRSNLRRGAIFPVLTVNRKYVSILFLPPAG